MFTSTLHDLTPHTRTLWDPRTHKSSTSDHIPVSTQLQPKHRPRNDLPTIPSWVSKHPDFPKQIEALLHSTKHIPQPGYGRHQFHKHIMYEASKHIITHAKNDSTTLDQKQYWTLAAFRHSHDSDHPLLQRSLLAYPALRQYFCATTCTDKQRLHDHLEQLTAELAQQRALYRPTNAQERQDNPTHSPSHSTHNNNLQQWLSQWSNKKKKSYTLHITTDDGAHTTTTQQTAQALHDYWAPKFHGAATRQDLARQHLEAHIQKIDPSKYQWTATTTQHEELLDRLHDTAPGPDGIRYSGYKNAPQPVQDTLYQQYYDILHLDHDTTPTAFNHSLLLFPPKGKHPDDDGHNYLRHPKDTRPISLSNTDNKYTSCLLDIPASKVSRDHVSPQQACLKGRQMGDNILDIEAKALTFALTNATLAGIIAYDISAAFPSLSRTFLFYVLTTMGFPSFYIRSIQRLYHDNLHTIFINNTTTITILFTSGVKQGCPLSMTLFALALDPIIRYMAHTISPHNGIVRAYCDDICISTGNLVLSLRHTYAIFLIIGLACNLTIHPKKTQIYCITRQGQSTLQRHINKYLPQLSNVKFTDSILYLGMYIGPGAHKHQYTLPLQKFNQSIAHIRSLGLGLLPSIPLYNQQSFPILTWKSSFMHPDTTALRNESKALQLLTNGPYNAIPTNLLHNLKQIGLPAQAHSLRTTSLAARTRNALHTINSYHDNVKLLHEQYQHDDTILRPPLQHWIDNSITLSLYNAVQTTQPLLHSISLVSHIQKQLTASLLPQIHKHDLEQLLRRRWIRFFTTQQLPIAINSATNNLHHITNNCKPCTTSAILKTWLYGWTTNNRFGNYSQPCPLCHSPNSDTLRHFYDCPPLSLASQHTLNQQYLPATRDYFFLTTHYDTSQPLHTQLLRLNAIHIYCITNTYHTIKHSPNNDIQDTYHACLKRLLQHDPRLVNTYLLAQSTQLYNEQSVPIHTTSTSATSN